jgi:DNA primase
LQLYNSITFSEARQILADRAGISTAMAAGHGARPDTSRTSILKANKWAAVIFRKALLGPAGEAARKYLQDRGISDEMNEAFQLGFAPDSYDFLRDQAVEVGGNPKSLLAAGLLRTGRDDQRPYDVFRNRLMFPILDPVGQVLGFGGRALGDDVAKYINSSENQVFSKRKVLYGLHRTRSGFKRDRAIVVEGYTDVIMAHQHGFEETVAALGTSLTENHAEILRRYVPRVIMLFDADTAGDRAAERAIGIAVQSQLDVFLAHLPDGLDPCDFLTARSTEEFEGCLNSAVSALEFRWRQIQEQHQQGESTVARLEAVREFVSFVGASAAFGTLDAIQRGLVVNQLVRLLGATRGEIEQALTEAGQRAAGSRPQQRGEVSSEMPDRVAVRSRPQDPEQAAAADILAIILCEPGSYPQVAEWFDPQRFVDASLRRIAETTALLVDQLGEFSVAEVLERLEEPGDTASVIDLVERARAAGRFEDQIQALTLRLQSLSCVRLSQRVEKELMAKTGMVPGSNTDEQDRKLAELHDHVADYTKGPNFAGLRKLRAES